MNPLEARKSERRLEKEKKVLRPERHEYMEEVYTAVVDDDQTVDVNKLSVADRNDLYLIAVKKNNLALVRQVLSLGAHVNSKDVLGQPALHHAVMGNHQELIELLIINKADVNATDPKRNTALHKAVMTHRDQQCILLLAVNGASIWLRNVESQTSVSYMINSIRDDAFWMQIIAHDAEGGVLAAPCGHPCCSSTGCSRRPNYSDRCSPAFCTRCWWRRTRAC